MTHADACSKTVENHAHAVALFTASHDFVRTRKALRVAPAMAAGVSDRLPDIAALLEACEAPPKKRGPCEKRDGNTT